MPKKTVSAKKKAAGKRLYNAQKKAANALYKKHKAKFDKMAKAWCSKKRSNKKRKSKTTGKMVNYNVYFQFRDAVVKAGGNNVLAQILWKKHCKHLVKAKSTTKKTTKKSTTKKTSSRKTTRKSTVKKKSTSSKKKSVSSGAAFSKAGKQLKKLKPRIKLSGASYNTLAKRRAAIAKAKKK